MDTSKLHTCVVDLKSCLRVTKPKQIPDYVHLMTKLYISVQLGFYDIARDKYFLVYTLLCLSNHPRVI